MSVFRVTSSRHFGVLCRSFSIRTWGWQETELFASTPKPSEKVIPPQGCPICQNGLERFGYRDVLLLRQFLTPEGYIINRRLTGICPRMQRRIAKSIRRSRQMGLLPNFALPKEKRHSKTPPSGKTKTN